MATDSKSGKKTDFGSTHVREKQFLFFLSASIFELPFYSAQILMNPITTNTWLNTKWLYRSGDLTYRELHEFQKEYLGNFNWFYHEVIVFVFACPLDHIYGKFEAETTGKQLVDRACIGAMKVLEHNIGVQVSMRLDRLCLAEERGRKLNYHYEICVRNI